MPELAELDSFAKKWLEALESRFGEMNGAREIKSGDGPLIYIYYFQDLPEPGYLTAVTCGLSLANHPAWTAGTPELIVTMQSSSHSWGMAAGYFASAFFGEKRFSYGDVFKIDDPISEESEMNAYLVFAPSFLDRDQAKFELGGKPIHLVGMYPLFNEEIAIYDRIGLKEFWHADGFDMDNPHRPRMPSVT
jgi:hypothetical protein